MRILATILVWTALIGSVSICTNWANAHSEVTKAADGYQLAQREIESTEALHASERQLEDSIVRNLNEGVGGQKGAKKLRSEADANIAQMRVTLSQLSEQEDIVQLTGVA